MYIFLIYLGLESNVKIDDVIKVMSEEERIKEEKNEKIKKQREKIERLNQKMNKIKDTIQTENIIESTLINKDSVDIKTKIDGMSKMFTNPKPFKIPFSDVTKEHLEMDKEKPKGIVDEFDDVSEIILSKPTRKTLVQKRKKPEF